MPQDQPVKPDLPDLRDRKVRQVSLALLVIRVQPVLLVQTVLLEQRDLPVRVSL